MKEDLLPAAGADPRDPFKERMDLGLGLQEMVITDSKPVGLVSNPLEKMERLGAFRKVRRLLLPDLIDPFKPLGKSDRRNFKAEPPQFVIDGAEMSPAPALRLTIAGDTSSGSAKSLFNSRSRKRSSRS